MIIIIVIVVACFVVIAVILVLSCMYRHRKKDASKTNEDMVKPDIKTYGSADTNGDITVAQSDTENVLPKDDKISDAEPGAVDEVELMYVKPKHTKTKMGKWVHGKFCDLMIYVKF